MGEINNFGRRMTSVSLSQEDFHFVKEKGLMFSQLLHDKIQELMGVSDGTVYTNTQTLYKKIDEMTQRINQFSEFIEGENLTQKYLDSIDFTGKKYK